MEGELTGCCGGAAAPETPFEAGRTAARQTMPEQQPVGGGLAVHLILARLNTHLADRKGRRRAEEERMRGQTLPAIHKPIPGRQGTYALTCHMVLDSVNCARLTPLSETLRSLILELFRAVSGDGVNVSGDGVEEIGVVDGGTGLRPSPTTPPHPSSRASMLRPKVAPLWRGCLLVLLECVHTHVQTGLHRRLYRS